MTSRINIARPSATTSYSSDPHGLGNSRPTPTSGFRASESDSPIDKLRAVATQVEDYIEIYSQPLKPYLPDIGRFLIVVTFLEDAWRIMTQWGDQLWYLQRLVTFEHEKLRRRGINSVDWLSASIDIGNSLGVFHTHSCWSTLLWAFCQVLFFWRQWRSTCIDYVTSEIWRSFSTPPLFLRKIIIVLSHGHWYNFLCCIFVLHTIRCSTFYAMPSICVTDSMLFSI